MTTEQAKNLQLELLDTVRRYNATGVAYDDIAKVVMHVASVVAITAEMKLDDSMKTFEFLFKLAQTEVEPFVKN